MLIRTIALAAAAALLAAGPAVAAPDAFGMKRCVNLGGALEARWEGEWGYTIQSAHLTKIAEAGFDTVRLPVAFVSHLTDDPAAPVREDLLKRLDQLIAEAGAAGLGVILTNHHETIHTDPAGQEARFVAMWTQIAKRYKDVDDRLSFHLLNEPQGPLMTGEVLSRLNAAALGVIRAESPQRWVLMSGPDYAHPRGWDTWRPPTGVPRVIVATGFYNPFSFTHQNAHWIVNPPTFPRAWGTQRDRAIVGREAQRMTLRARALLKTPIVLAEAGVITNAPIAERALWARIMRDAFEKQKIGWCWWDFASTFAIYDAKADAWIEPMRDALVGAGPLSAPAQ